MRYLSIIGGLALYPDKYIRILIHEERSIIEALFTVILFQAMLSIMYVAAIRSILLSLSLFMPLPFLSPLVNLFLPIIVPLMVITGLITWIIWSLATHIIAKLLGGVGEYIHLLRIMGYSWFTLIIPIIPLFFYPASPIASLLASTLFTLVSCGWIIYINYHGIKEIYGLGGVEAFLALIIPPLLVITLIAIAPIFRPAYIPPGW